MDRRCQRNHVLRRGALSEAGRALRLNTVRHESPLLTPAVADPRPCGSRSAMREHEQGSTLGIAVHTGTRSRSQRVALTTNIVLES